jgi:hypothetical protein
VCGLTATAKRRPGNFEGVVMPRKSKAFKSRMREAQKACGRGKTEEANKIWQQITLDRAKLKAEKEAKHAAKRAAKKAKLAAPTA